MKIAFFGTKPYDKESFETANARYKFDIHYHKSHLNTENAILTHGTETVCIFVNDDANADAIEIMAKNGVKLLTLRCAGFNNVDLKAARQYGITVVRVPAYSPDAVAE